MSKLIETLGEDGITVREKTAGGVITGYCVKIPLRKGIPSLVPVVEDDCTAWWWGLAEAGYAWVCFRDRAHPGLKWLVENSIDNRA